MWPLLILALGVHAETAVAETPDAGQWLVDMRQAVSRLNYRGVVAYLKDKKVESFQIFHASMGGVERERLVSMNSPLREVVRNAERVTCYFPDTKTVFVENKPSKRSVLLDLPEDPAQISRYYRVTAEGQELVTQRLSQVIAIEPRDGYRYARRIWVDLDSKLPLKFELLDERGRVVEQMVFTSLSVENSIPGTDLNPSTQVDSFEWKTSQRESLPLDALDWTLSKVPEGFQLVSYTRLKRPPTNRPVDHILLSDGLSSVSIYIDEAVNGGAAAKSRPKRLGAINVHVRKIDNYYITVMGEVPAETAKLIAHGLVRGDESRP